MYTYYDDGTTKITIEGSEFNLGCYWIYLNDYPVAFAVDVEDAKKIAAETLTTKQQSDESLAKAWEGVS